jgi:mercuric ion transport protein
VKDQGFRLRTGRVGFFILSVLFAASVLAQVYIAGAATFVNPANWAKHIEFVHLFGFTIPLLMLIFAYIGRLPRRSLIHVMGMMLTIFIMYFTANITSTQPWAGAMHPVIAVVMAGQSMANVTNAWNLIIKNKREEQTK